MPREMYYPSITVFEEETGIKINPNYLIKGIVSGVMVTFQKPIKRKLK